MEGGFDKVVLEWFVITSGLAQQPPKRDREGRVGTQAGQVLVRRNSKCWEGWAPETEAGHSLRRRAGVMEKRGVCSRLL